MIEIPEEHKSKAHILEVARQFKPQTTFGPMDEAELNILNILKDSDKSDTDKRAALIEEILSRIEIRALSDTGEILHYRDGIYCQGGKDRILAELQELGGYDITNHTRSEIVETIRIKKSTERKAFDSDPDWLHVANGWVNIYTGEFEEHSRERLSMRKLPVEYKVGATCPAIFNFFESTMGDPELLAIALRMIAYCLLPSSKYETAFILIGEGANGKSTMIKLIKALLGPENCSAIALQDLASDRFAKAELYGKMVNLFPDLTSERVKEGDFKPIVSGDRIRAQRKYGQPFEFENTAKLIFSTNNIPATEDDSYAYFRRWIILPFNRTFEGEDRDVHLLDKITTPEELSGLLYWALQMLSQLIQENGFQHSDIEEVRKQYQLGASRIQDFIRDCCKLGEDESVRTAELNNALARYCKSKGSNYVDIRELGKKLSTLGIEHKQKRVKPERAWFYFGIGLKGDVTVSQSESLLPCTTLENSIVEGGSEPVTVTLRQEHTE